MIRRLHITGFQSLEDVDIPLGRFTVIQGRSNSGKSAVIRALRAVVTNGGNLRGTGGSFIHHGSKACSVLIEREDRSLTWVKTPTKTTYDLDGRVFTTGQDVPEEVADFLKLGDIIIDEANSLKVNVNFQGGARGQGQFEPPFLVVDKTGSYLAKVLALLTSANVLYAAQAVAKKDSRANGGKLKTVRELHEAELARLTSLRAEYAPLHVAAERARALQTALEATLSERDRLVAYRAGIAKLDADLLECTAELQRLQSLDLSSSQRLQEQADQLVGLTQWLGLYNVLDTAQAAIDAELSTTLPADIADRITAADAQVTQAATLRSWLSAVTSTDRELSSLDAQSSEVEAGAQDAASALIALIDEIGVCPTCEQAMHAEVLVS